MYPAMTGRMSFDNAMCPMVDKVSSCLTSASKLPHENNCPYRRLTSAVQNLACDPTVVYSQALRSLYVTF